MPAENFSSQHAGLANWTGSVRFPSPIRLGGVCGASANGAPQLITKGISRPGVQRSPIGLWANFSILICRSGREKRFQISLETRSQFSGKTGAVGALLFMDYGCLEVVH